MLVWFLNRLLHGIGVLLAVSAIVFVGLHAIGNPADSLIAPNADAAERLRVIAAFGLDQPLWRQYLLFLRSLLHGDLGSSFVFGEPALRLIAERMPATLELAAAAMLLAVLVGVPLGLYAGLRPHSLLGRALTTGAILGSSLPGFWLGLMLILLFSVALGWLPSTGRGETVELLGMCWSFLTVSGLRHLALPALNLALFEIALLLRLTQSGVRETMPLDFVRFARAKGLPPTQVVMVHVLRAVLTPIVTNIGVEFGGVIAFSLVTEWVFAWPGMGRLMLQSIAVLDRPVIVAYLMVVAAIFVLINMLVDLAAHALDPRLRLRGAG